MLHAIRVLCVLFSVQNAWGQLFSDQLYVALAEEGWKSNYTNFFNVTVNNPNDALPADASKCESGNKCNLRNAVSYCSLKLNATTDHCTVFLPPQSQIGITNSEILVENTAGNMTIMGQGSLVYKTSNVLDYRLFAIISVRRGEFAFNIHNVTIEGLGSLGDDGGALFLQFVSSSYLQHITFISNKGRDGGAIDMQFSSFVTIYGCKFNGNFARGNGGAIGIGDRNERITISKSRFDSNYALELGTIGGGFGAGGCVAVDQNNRNLTFVENVFVNCSATLGAGLSLGEENSDIAISNCAFLRNNALVDGGGLYSHDTNRDLSLTNVLFKDNTCLYLGGGIFFYRNTNRVLFDSVRFQSNRAQDGGGFYGYYDNAGLEFVNCTFFNNSALDGGGAFFLDQNSPRLSIKDCHFEGNYAQHQGGAVKSTSNEYFSIIRSTFINNVCYAGEGGAVKFGINNDRSVVSETLFQNNRAETDGGGLFYSANNNFITIRNVSFISNRASNYGGGLSLRSNNNNGVISDCNFYSNFAGSAGGAIHSALRNSFLSLDNVNFEFNIGTSYAGGLYVGNDHENVTMKGGVVKSNTARNGAGIYVSQFNTNFGFNSVIFLKNRADDDGGGMMTYANLFEMLNCMFVDNEAVGNCGGMCVGEASLGASHSAIFNNCSFVGNTASDSYGGLQIAYRDGVRIRYNYYEENHALMGFGGGLTIMFSSDVLVDQNIFLKNDCLLGGGGLNLVGIENATVINSTINENRAIRGDGGGVRTQMTSGLLIKRCNVIKNVALYEGGAFHFSGIDISHLNLLSDIFVEDSNIQHNVATESSGSAIWVTQCYLEVNRNMFAYNSAPMGGGTLFWSAFSGMAEPTSSGNTWSTTNYGLYGSKWATETYALVAIHEDQTISLSNSLNVTSYDTSVPHFIVRLVDFYEQLLLIDNSTMVDVAIPPNTQCSDYQNRYNLSGYVAGSIAERASKGIAEFSALTATCAPGDEMIIDLSVEASQVDSGNYHGPLSSQISLYFRRCERGEILLEGHCEKCEAGTYSFNPYDGEGCIPCPDNAYCPGGHVIEVESGYWRQCEDCHEIVVCMNADACEGGASVLNQCQSGHEGPLCNVCSENFAFGADDMTCTECDNNTTQRTLTVVAVVGGILLILSLFVIIKRNWVMQKIDELSAKLTEMAEKYKFESCLTKVKICLVFLQILGGLPTITSVPYPKSFQTVMNAMAFTNFNIFALFSVGCVADYNFYDALRLYTVGPVLLLVGIMFLVQLRMIMSKRLNPHNPSYTYKHKNTDRKRLLIIVGFIFFSPASVKIFQTFVCDEFEDGTRTLVADSSVNCDTDTHLYYTLYAVGMLFVYPIGIPLFYFRNLYRVRHLVNPDKSLVASDEEIVLLSNGVIQRGKMKLREGYENIQKISFLYDSYVPEMWFFEIVECFRRLFLTAVPILFLRSSVLQIILILLISLGCSALYMQVQPFAKDSDNSVAKCSQWAISLTVLGSLCLKVDLSEEISYAEELIGILMIIINIFVLGLTIQAAVAPNSTDIKEHAAFEAFNKKLHEEIKVQEEAKKRREKIGTMGLTKAERITEWEARQSSLLNDSDELPRRSFANLDGFDSDDDSDDEFSNDGSDSPENKEISRKTNNIEMTAISNPIRH